MGSYPERRLAASWSEWHKEGVGEELLAPLSPSVAAKFRGAKEGTSAGVVELIVRAAAQCATTEEDHRTVILAAWIAGHGALVSHMRPDCSMHGKPIRLSGLKYQESAQNRFASYSQASAESAGCIDWTGTLGTSGYGFLSVTTTQGRTISLRAHRLAWILAGRELPPEGMVIRHKCDRPCCVNPAHLEAGTILENMRDKEQRGRSGVEKRVGAQAYNARLSERDAMRLRATPLRISGHLEEAQGLGVSQNCVAKVRSGVTWKHLPMPGEARFLEELTTHGLGHLALLKH